MSKTNQADFDKEEDLIKSALRCLESRMKYQAAYSIKDPQDALAYLRLQLARELNEVFAVIFLNAGNQVIAFEKLFQGTIASGTVHPRVVLQKALAHNAAAVLFAHNHPSGNIEPSENDQKITQNLITILNIVDVRVIDHIIVSLNNGYSFAEHGLI